MAMTRRGFLQTLTTALAGAAVFDPKTLLWTPRPVRAEPIILADAATVDAVVAEQLELNELAMRFAKAMADQTISGRQLDKALVLRDVMYRHTGSTHLPKDLLDVDGRGQGFFAPNGRVLLPTQYRDSYNMATIAREYASKARRVEMFAPIDADMRPGTPFADLKVGVATDPDSGLSARVLRWDHDHGYGKTTMTGFEMATGTWAHFDARSWERARRRKLITEYHESAYERMYPSDDEDDVIDEGEDGA